jgi:hypothetical protein
MPDLILNLQDLEFTIPPQGYVFEPEGKTAPCDIAVAQLQTSFYILGDIFFRNFVVSFNYSDTTIKIGTNVNAYPGTKIKKLPPPWFWISTGSFVGAAILGFGIYFMIRNKKKDGIPTEMRESTFLPSAP